MTKEPNKTEQAKRRMLEAMETKLGIVTAACELAEIGRTQYYKWLKDDQEFNDNVNLLREVRLDYAESSIMRQIEKDSFQAAKLLLEKDGQDRGWGGPQSIDVTSNNEKIQIILDVNDKTGTKQ